MSSKFIADERISFVTISGDWLSFWLHDNRILSVPRTWFPRLASATLNQLEDWEVVGAGFVVRWAQLDEDLEITGLLAGNAAPNTREETVVDASSIREYRQRCGISQVDLARQLGVRQATISDWEKGKSAPSPLAAPRLADLIRKAHLANEKPDVGSTSRRLVSVVDSRSTKGSATAPSSVGSQRLSVGVYQFTDLVPSTTQTDLKIWHGGNCARDFVEWTTVETR